VESLLHSQLAFMETDERPDLFDIKFLRDELLYYARDENHFLRRRRTFVFALYPDLVHARFKDAALPWQRMILVLALLVVAVRKLSEWLTAEALVFEFLFVEEQGDPLAAERILVQTILREAIASGTVLLAQAPADRVGTRCAVRARRSLCHCLALSTRDQPFGAEHTHVSRLRLGGASPALTLEDAAWNQPERADALEAWEAVLHALLQYWV
jgi:hypothetical protein